MKICSYELGVVVWPALWNDDDEDNDDDKDARRGDASASASASARMVPVFGGDMPSEGDEGGENGDDENEARYAKPRKQGVTVGWRMPYDLPLVPYGKDEKPWCATEACDEPDWMGRVWSGYAR